MGSTDSSDPRLRLLLVADVRLYREGLAAALGQGRMNVVGMASSRVDASLTAQSVRPDVVIIDVALPDSFDLMRELRADLPTARLIAFAVDDDIAAIVNCAEAGASGYVSVDAGISDLVIAIERAAQGELLCSPRVAAELFRRVGDRSGRRDVAVADGPALTARERQVLALVRQRLSNKEVAVALNISEATVKNHVHHLLDKLQVSSRAQAAACLPSASRTSTRHARVS
jgi:two-component system nitrate/nitrite response regulator NarL